MRMSVLLLLLTALLVGCQAQPKANHAASAPKAIMALTDQTLVYSCPSCGMDYDGPGKCPMDDADLVQTQVAYICPADDKPVTRAGKCPRCNASVRVVKTAVAAETTHPGAAGDGAGSKPPAAASSGAASGS